jgi:hypothetical protein
MKKFFALFAFACALITTPVPAQNPMPLTPPQQASLDRKFTVTIHRCGTPQNVLTSVGINYPRALAAAASYADLLALVTAAQTQDTTDVNTAITNQVPRVCDDRIWIYALFSDGTDKIALGTAPSATGVYPIGQGGFNQ